jgi:hypothetical protein
MSQSDSTGISEQYMNVLKSPTIESYNQFKVIFSQGVIQDRLKHRVFKLADFKGKLKTFLPWVFAENKEIYKMVRSGQFYGQGHGHEKKNIFFQ